MMRGLREGLCGINLLEENEGKSVGDLREVLCGIN